MCSRWALHPWHDFLELTFSVDKAVMSSISLRRTKEMKSKDGKPLIDLPTLSFYTVSIPLDDAQRASYDKVAEESKRFLKEYLQARDSAASRAEAISAPSYANVLSLLTRMRQLCLHEDLVPADFVSSLGSPVEQSAVVKPEDMEKLQKAFKQMLDDSEECGGEF